MIINQYLNNIIAAEKLLNDSDFLFVLSQNGTVTIRIEDDCLIAHWNDDDVTIINRLSEIWNRVLPRVKTKIKNDYLEKIVKKQLALKGFTDLK